MRFDLHCHTRGASPDSFISLDETVRLLKKSGYDGMLITDHNSYKSCVNLDRFVDFVVLKGIEYDTLDGGHVIIVLPSHVDLHIFEYKGLPLDITIKVVHLLGGIIGPAHAYDFSKLGVCNTRNNRDEVLQQFDFIETFNGCLYGKSSVKCTDLAKRLNKVCFGGSDSHMRLKVGLGYTNIPFDIRTEDDLIRVVKEGDFNTLSVGGSFFERRSVLMHKMGITSAGFCYGNLTKFYFVKFHKIHKLLLSNIYAMCNSINPLL